jgi:hypothetical protein
MDIFKAKESGVKEWLSRKPWKLPRSETAET